MKTLFRGLVVGLFVAAVMVGVCVAVLKAMERWPVWTTVAVLLLVVVVFSELVGSFLKSGDGE